MKTQPAFATEKNDLCDQHDALMKNCNLPTYEHLTEINADLLAALEHLLANATEHLQDGPNSGVLIEARAAIAKAVQS